MCGGFNRAGWDFSGHTSSVQIPHFVWVSVSQVFVLLWMTIVGQQIYYTSAENTSLRFIHSLLHDIRSSWTCITALSCSTVAFSTKPKHPSVMATTENKRKGRRKGKGKGKGRKKNPCLREYKDFCIHGVCHYLKELQSHTCVWVSCISFTFFFILQPLENNLWFIYQWALCCNIFNKGMKKDIYLFSFSRCALSKLTQECDKE